MQRREFVERIASTLATTLSAARWSELTAASAFAVAVPATAPWEFLQPDQARLLEEAEAVISKQNLSRELAINRIRDALRKLERSGERGR